MSSVAEEPVERGVAGKEQALEALRRAILAGDGPGTTTGRGRARGELPGHAGLGRLDAQPVRHQFRLAPQPGRSKASLAQNVAIVEAIRDRDPKRAELAARHHLVSVIDALRRAEDGGR